MTTCPPPYRPLRGAAPPHFVDRDDPQDVWASGIVAASVAACAAGPCDPRFHRSIIAGPAMGKTALLREIGREVAGRLGWAVTLHTCRAKERALRVVSATVEATLEQWPAPTAPPGQGAGFNHRDPEATNGLASVTRPDGGPSPWAALRHLLDRAGRRARSCSRGVLLMFDDADRLGGAELYSLGYLARSLSRDDLPVALFFSGGPQLGHRFARACNFSECIWMTSLAGLDDGDAREALVVPAADGGVEFEEEALELLCRAAGGSPLELQRLGFAAWSAAGDAGVVTLAVARRALGLLAQGAEARAS